MYQFMYKKNRFHFVVVYSVIDAQRTSQHVKNISNHILVLTTL